MEKFIQIGFTKKAYGVKGEMKMKIEEKYVEDFFQAQIVFLNIGGKKVPFFVDNVRVGNTLLAKFEDIDSPEDALTITSKEVFLREKDIIPEENRLLEVEETLVFKKYEGFLMEDINEGKIGIIEEILEYPQQEMALIKYQGKELLIPMNEQLIESVDEEQKTIVMKLPEGLLDL